MTPEEEAYEEGLRRIRQAEEAGALELDLSGLETLNRLPPELEHLTSLQSLNLYGCWQLSGDLVPLASLTSLQSINLAYCRQLSDLSPLATLTSLQTLNLSQVRAAQRFIPAGRPHLATKARTLPVQPALGQLVNASEPHLAPIARSLRVLAAQRRLVLAG
jgi:Leucine Rich repeats (2 copies)